MMIGDNMKLNLSSSFCHSFFFIFLIATDIVHGVPLQGQNYELQNDIINNDTVTVDSETKEVIQVIKTVENNDEDLISTEQLAEQIKKINERAEDDIDAKFPSFGVNSENIEFILFTKNKPTRYILKINHNDTLKASTYNVTKKTKILIHGWIQKGQSFIDRFKTVYLKKQDVNLIFVDWGEYSRNEYQYTIMYIVPQVAQAVEALINNFIAYGTSVQDIHLIGFSLGAHISSYAAKNLKPRLARITGLDPAGIGYTGVMGAPRLSSADAEFVDVIHTSGRGGGLATAIGTVDFYPNGGNAQPGCMMGNFVCYHFRVLDLFEESITNETHFFSTPCSSYNEYHDKQCKYRKEEIMGEYVSHKIFGKYYLKTNSEAPFALGREYRRSQV